MADRVTVTLPRAVRQGVLAAALAVSPVAAARGDDAASTSALEWQFLEAETALAQGEPRVAASHYRGAVREAWLLLGLVEVAAGELGAARDALARARDAAAVDLAPARVALALVELRLGGVEQPLRELRLTSQEDHRNADLLRRFVEALWATGREDELRAELEKLRALDPAAAAAVTRASDSTTVPRRAPLPEVGNLEAATGESRDRLRARLAASLVRAYRNLAALHQRTGFTRGIAGLDAHAGGVGTKYPRARDPFGKLDLSADQPVERIRPLELDPVALMASAPASLHPVVELLDGGELEAAAAELQRRAGAAAPDAAAARALLGLLRALEGDLEAAEAELLRAVATPSGPAPGAVALGAVAAHQALARLYWHGGRRADVAGHLRRAAELGPLDRDLGLALAEIELAAGRPAAARPQLRSLDKRFGSVEALLRLVRVARLEGQEKQAFDAAERASRQAPNSEEVLLTHARLALEVGVVGSAARSVEPLVRMRPEVAEYRVLIGRVWSQRRKMGEAAEAFLKAVEIDPDHVPAFLRLGLALNHESRFEEARRYLERYLEARGEDLDALAGLAESEARLGEAAAAERRALGVLEQDPANARAHLVAGMVLAGRGDFAAAREAFRQAVDADPLLAKAHYQLSLACARLGDRGCAEAHLALYKQALEGPEATYVQLQPAAGTTLMMKKRDAPENPSPP